MYQSPACGAVIDNAAQGDAWEKTALILPRSWLTSISTNEAVFF